MQASLCNDAHMNRADNATIRRIVVRKCKRAGLSRFDTIDAVEIALDAYVYDRMPIQQAMHQADEFINHYVQVYGGLCNE